MKPLRLAGLAMMAGGLALPCLAMPSVALAEVLRVDGIYPAASDQAAALRTIMVETIGGIDGPGLGIRIEDALREVSLEGRPYFRILPRSETHRTDAVLRGTADSEVTFNRYTQEREECATKDAGGKCTERRKVQVPCTRRKVELLIGLRLVAASGELLHADNAPESLETSSCQGDDTAPRSRADIVRELSTRIASRLRFAFAPVFRSEAIRVNESRRGLSGGDAERFKQAVRLTKSDTAAACREWDAITAANPGHAPSLFNTALCAEAAGQDRLAGERYDRLQQLEPRSGEMREGLARLAARDRARRQLEAHRRD